MKTGLALFSPSANLNRRDFVLGAAALSLAAPCGCQRRRGNEDGDAFAWRRGHFQIHQIYTGTAESQFLIFPDGTTMLLDCGDSNPHTFQAKAHPHGELPILPNEARRAGEWIARYVQRVNPNGCDVDYMFLTHFHGDHSGSLADSAGVRTDLLPNGEPYHRSGFGLAAETLHFRRAIDRGWPNYDDPLPYPKSERWMGGSLTVMRKVYRYLSARDGLTVEKFQVGSHDQIRLLREPTSFPDFAVFNLCGNGKIAMRDGSVFDCYAQEAKRRRECTFNENAMSCGNVFTYGKFRFYTAGDVMEDRLYTNYRGKKCRIEQVLAHAVDPVSVAKADHHACWGNPTELIAALRPKVWTIPVWWKLHCTRQVMNQLASQKNYSGERLILPGVLCAERRREDAREPYLAAVPEAVHTPSHVVIDVPPGGETFQVFCLDATDEAMRVKTSWRLST